MKIKVGDCVKIRPDSEWYNPKADYLKESNPIDVVGVVMEILPSDPDSLVIDVKWPASYANGDPIMNTYAEHDLEVVAS